jgi:hypothetical protein
LAFFDALIGDEYLSFFITDNKIFPFETHENITDQNFFNISKMQLFGEFLQPFKRIIKPEAINATQKKIEDKQKILEDIKYEKRKYK